MMPHAPAAVTGCFDGNTLEIEKWESYKTSRAPRSLSCGEPRSRIGAGRRHTS